MSEDERKTGQAFQDLNRVLDAEKAAQAKVTAAAAEAEAMVLSAHEKAREIAARTDRRIQALHTRFLAALERKKANIGEAFLQEKGARGAPLPPEEIKEVARRFAADLVGVSPK